jgi:ferredoxin-nitrite reductase
MDGCPHACAHHWVGDIGLQGTTATNPETGVRGEAYNLRLRGRLGAGAAIGVPLIRRIPSEDISEVVCRLVKAWVDMKAVEGPELTFSDFLALHEDDELRQICNGEAAVAAGESETPATKPLVRIPGMLLETTGGADLIEVEARTVGGILAELKSRFPLLAEQVLGPAGEVIPSVNVFLGEDDIRFLDGLDTAVTAGQELTILPALSGGC